jgi:PAS domain S-box-containing protein
VPGMRGNGFLARAATAATSIFTGLTLWSTLRTALPRPNPGLAAATEALRQSEERWRLLVESVQDYAIFMLDLEGRVASWNTGAERIKGYRPDEILGRSLSVFYTPDDIADGTPEHTLERAAAEGRVEAEGWRVRKDGTRFWADVVVSAIRDSEGRLVGYAKVTRDLTERKRTEEALRSAQEELARRERLAILGQLAGGVGHELRNPLGVIKNSVYYLRMVLPGEEERVRKHLSILEREVGNANRIVADLLEFGRAVPTARKPSDLNPLVRELLEVTSVPEPIQFRLALAPDLPRISVDPEQVKQVLANLLTNAVQAMPDGGRLTIATETGGDGVVLSVTDTGLGIAPEDMPKLFQPLFTTKAKGMGFGLALSKRLAEANGAVITVESAVGRGSRFAVRFSSPTAGG